MNTETITPTKSTALTIPESLPLDQNPAAVFLAAKKENSRRVYKSDLDTIAGMLTQDPESLNCNWAALRYQHTAAIKARLQETISEKTGKPLSPATVNRMLSALRGVLKTAWRLGQITAEEYSRAVDIQSVESKTLPAGRELQPGEIAALMAACENDSSPAGVRDAAIIALAYSCGLRRAELTSLDLADYESDSGKLIVSGKRNKERTAYLVNGAKRAMADWLIIRGSDSGPLFWPINKGGSTFNRRMTTQAIYNLLSKRADQAEVKEFSPHDMRRTFVSDLLDAGADISIVAQLAGHASVTTTARYDRRPEQAKQKAAGLLHVPYRGRLV